MKGSSVIMSVHYLKLAHEFMDDFIRERPNAALTRLFKSYKGRIEWMFQNMKSEPTMPKIVIDGINQELNSDVPAVIDIQRKIHLLNPNKREFVEIIIDRLLNGEEMNIQLEEKEVNA